MKYTLELDENGIRILRLALQLARMNYLKTLPLLAQAMLDIDLQLKGVAEEHGLLESLGATHIERGSA